MINDKINLSRPDAVRFTGIWDRRIRALSTGLFRRLDMKAVVDFFRLTLDPFAAGEFFGKLLRAACPICLYSGDGELRKVVDGMVRDILSVQAPDGNISTTPREKQPNGTHGSDLWERKYVMLGLLEYYDSFGGEDVLDALRRLALYTASQVGEPPKTPITATGWAFCGIESSSILEPIVKIYRLTGDPELKELADHIVNRGCCSRENMFEAIRNGKSPKDVGNNGNPKESIAKAYEMMSCFEGLIEYYRITGEEIHLETAKKFIDKINTEEITLLGSGGADAPYNLGPGTGEQWNYTAYEQTNPDIVLAMETCVTITYMKLMLQYYRISGDPAAVDKIEISAYNALLGAMRKDGSFFDYFPKFNGTRSTKVNFSYDISGFPLSCCTANGPAGMAVLPRLALVTDREGSLILNLFIPGTYRIPGGTLTVETRYPENGTVKLLFLTENKTHLKLKIRIPGFCEGLTASESFTAENGYAIFDRTRNFADRLEFTLLYQPALHPSPKGSNRLGDNQVLFTYGPCVLARDKSADPAYDRPVSPDFSGKYEIVSGCPETEQSFLLKADGMIFLPYYAAGSSWDEKTEYRSWLKKA